MKRMFLYMGLSCFLVLLAACRITGTGDINEAELYVQNLTANTVYLTIDDGSLGPFPEIELASGQAYIRTWESGDEVFTLNIGIVILHYYDNIDLDQTVYINIQLGSTAYYDIDVVDYNLVVDNETSADCWFTVDGSNLYTIESSESIEFNFGEHDFDLEVPIDYTGYHVFSQQEIIILPPYQTVEFNIQADAGAIRIVNNTLSNIEQVYIAESSSSYWGPDQLSGLLEPNDEAFWTVADGWWDVLIIDEWGAEQLFTEILIQIDQTDTIMLRESVSLMTSNKIKGINLHYRQPERKIKPD